MLEDLSSVTAKTTEKTREALDSYFNIMQKSISLYPWDNTEVGKILKSVAEENIAAFMIIYAN